MRVVGMDMKLVNSFQGLKYEIPLVIIRHFLCYYFDLPFVFPEGGRLQMTIQIVPGPQRHLRAGVTWCTQDDNRNRGSSMDTHQTMT